MGISLSCAALSAAARLRRQSRWSAASRASKPLAYATTLSDTGPASGARVAQRAGATAAAASTAAASSAVAARRPSPVSTQSTGTTVPSASGAAARPPTVDMKSSSKGRAPRATKDRPTQRNRPFLSRSRSDTSGAAASPRTRSPAV